MHAPAQLSEPGSVLELPLLQRAECDALAASLRELDAFWLPRHPRLPFHTLGATHYYDLAAGSAARYQQRAAQYNRLLMAQFAGLYERLRAALATGLAAPVSYRQDAALPGFQLFAAAPDFGPGQDRDVMQAQWLATRHAEAYPGNPIHIDHAHRCLRWPPGIDPDRLPTLSFTLPIELPASGAGLRLWPRSGADLAHCSEPQRLQALQCSPPHELSYQPGQLLLHSGQAYHQARGLPWQDGDMRITLQGNGLQVDGRWQLFW